jgi:D-alanyl-D-alanine carboxypeptidase (penicillin-binding protein 5/6)
MHDRSPDSVGVVTAGRLVAALTAAALAMPAGVAALPAPAAAAPPRGIVKPLAVGRAPTVPCPKPKVAPPTGRPKRPVPPPDDPTQQSVGGPALATGGLVVPPGAPPPPALTATSWLVADLDSGAVLGACGPHVYGTPASVQKLLLVATVLPKLNPKQVVKVTRADLAIEPGSSAVGLLDGGKYDVRTLWLGLLLNSGNDAANALARVGGGAAGLPGTVAAMNAEAQRLGAYQTHAVTPSGLDGPGQFTSAYDLALIARVCFGYAAFRTYALTKQVQVPAQPPKTTRGFQIQNENKLIYNYPGAMGGKTGFTTLARHSYVGAANRGGRRLVATLLGAEAQPRRGWQQGAALLDWGFSLPAEASVGQLVAPTADPGEGATDGQPAAGTPAPPIVPTASRAGATYAMSIPIAATAAAVLAAAPMMLVLSARRRRMRRRVRRHHD